MVFGEICVDYNVAMSGKSLGSESLNRIQREQSGSHIARGCKEKAESNVLEDILFK
jgi:hypothetical protein